MCHIQDELMERHKKGGLIHGPLDLPLSSDVVKEATLTAFASWPASQKRQLELPKSDLELLVRMSLSLLSQRPTVRVFLSRMALSQ